MGHENGGWMNSDQRDAVRDRAENQPDPAFEALSTDELRQIVAEVLRDPLSNPKRDGAWVRRAAMELDRRDRKSPELNEAQINDRQAGRNMAAQVVHFFDDELTGRTSHFQAGFIEQLKQLLAQQ